jgi:hypothetical protein
VAKAKNLQIMARCFNMKCGTWIIANKTDRKFCCKACSDAYWAARRWVKHNRPHLGATFHCPYCEQDVKRRGPNQKTCGAKRCQMTRNAELQRQIKSGRYLPKRRRPAPSETSKAGWTNCLGSCEKKFWSRDVTRFRFCPQCRSTYYSNRQEYAYAPVGY